MGHGTTGSAGRQPRTEPPRTAQPQGYRQHGGGDGQPRAQRLPPRTLPPGAQQRPTGWAERERKEAERRGVGALGVIGLGLLAVVAVAGAGAGYLYLNPPTGFIRDRLVAEVKARTGRDLVIGGPTRFTLYPSIGVSMANVQLSAPAAMGGAPLLRTAGLDVSIKLWPLLTRDVQLERLTLRQPTIELRTDRNGRRSWDFASGENAPPVRLAAAEIAQAGARTATDVAPQATQARPATGAKISGIERLALEDVRIENGTLVFSDERDGQRHTATALNATLAMASIDSPLDVTGNFTWKNEPVKVKGSVTSLAEVLAQKPAKVALNAELRPLSVTYDGGVTMKNGFDARGAVTVKSASLRSLAVLAGVALPPGPGFGAASVAGKLDASSVHASLTDATIVLDGTTATGGVGVETKGARPYVKANLKLKELDLNKHLAGLGDGAPAEASPAPAPAPARAPTAAPAPAARSAGNPSSIEDLLKDAPTAPGTKVKGYARRDAWSEEPIGVAALGLADADVRLELGKLVWQEIKAGQTQVALALKNKVLKTTLDEVQLYQGRAKGVVTLDGNSGQPAVSANITADGLQALPLLKDAADMDWLAGTTRAVLAVNGQGATQKAIMESLSGKADLTFNNGAIVGWNIPQMVRGLRQGQFSGFDRVQTSKTDFSELSSSWTIAGGVAQNQDLRMTTPLLRVTGGGQVGLGARTVDYVLKPKVVASLDGQGGAQGLQGLEIPLRIRGPWSRPEYTPELGGILKDPSQAIGAIKELGKQFKGKKPDEIVNQVLGDNPGTAKKANDLLNKLLKPKSPPAQ